MAGNTSIFVNDRRPAIRYAEVVITDVEEVPETSALDMFGLAP
jgi:hypothetical protein